MRRTAAPGSRLKSAAPPHRGGYPRASGRAIGGLLGAVRPAAEFKIGRSPSGLPCAFNRFGLEGLAHRNRPIKWSLIPIHQAWPMPDHGCGILEGKSVNPNHSKFPVPTDRFPVRAEKFSVPV